MVQVGREMPFSPLGASGNITISPPGFGIRDDQHFLCFNNCKQSRFCLVGVRTKDIVIAVQGTPLLEGADLLAQLDSVCDTIMRFNGGHRDEASEIVITEPDAPGLPGMSPGAFPPSPQA